MKVATVEKVLSIIDHPNADALQIANILGWNVVCKKNECKVGDLVAFVNIDSIVKPHAEFSFLESKSYRIRPVKIRGQMSQGLLIPIRNLEKFGKVDWANLSEGDDISEILGATHYEKKIPSKVEGNTKGKFPSFLIRTDENNLRNYPEALKEIEGKEVYITKKIDGCSATYFVRNCNFGVCSRSLELHPDENAFWSIVKKYDLAYKMLNLPHNIAIQGEIYGPNIQNNPLKVKELAFAAYNLFYINGSSYGSYDELTTICEDFQIPQTEVVYCGIMKFSLKELIELANNQYYSNNVPCEGIVIRTTEPVSSKIIGINRWSAKVLNENYDT